MRKQNLTKEMNLIITFLINYSTTILFTILIAFAIPLSRLSVKYIVGELIVRLSRDSVLVLSLLIPVMAGMGLNFSIVLGAMAGQISLILITDWQVIGMLGILLAILISTPIAILIGYFAGIILNHAKKREMVTGFMLSFFMNGIYQIIVLFGMGKIIPIFNSRILLPRGYGIRNVINLAEIRQVLDNLIPLKIGDTKIPFASFLVIAAFSILIIWFNKTKLGHTIRTVGQDNEIARVLGINPERTRILSIIISTVLACYGQIIFLQNVGTINTYNSHEQVGIFAIAALLVGGGSVTKASVPNVFLGVVLFHTMFVVAPRAGMELIGQAQLGEYFRVFVSYGVIASSLALYAWRKRREEGKKREARKP